MADGDFTVPDAQPQASTNLDTLFGVNQNVGTAPITLRGPRMPDSFAPSGVAPVGPSVSSTLTEVLQGFYGMDPEALTNLQKQLWSGGFYSSSYYGKTPKPPQFGTPDDDSYAAFKSAVVQAARSGQPLNDLVDQAVKANGASGGLGGGGARAPLVTQLTNPDDIRAAVVREAKATLGHKVDEATINDIITRYQQADAEAQAGVYRSQVGGGTVTAAPSVSAFAQQQVLASNPADAVAHRGLGVGNLILNAFMSGAGNAPLGGTGG